MSKTKPALTPDDQAELDAIDADFQRSQAQHRRAKALSRELFLILLLCVAILVVPLLLMIVGYTYLGVAAVAEWRLNEITLYFFIVGTTVSGWGAWRSMFGWGIPERGHIFVLYGLRFGMAFIFYALLYYLLASAIVPPRAY